MTDVDDYLKFREEFKELIISELISEISFKLPMDARTLALIDTLRERLNLFAPTI